MSVWSGLINRARILTDSRYRHVYAQRRITEMSERRSAADRFASRLPPQAEIGEHQDLFQKLESDGYAPVRDLVSSEQISDIKGYLSQKLCFDPYKKSVGKFKAPNEVVPGTHVAYFDSSDIVQAPHLLAIANNPSVLAAVGNVLGAKPTISYLAAWWSIAHGERAREAELFHRDVDDLRFVKLFVYLTDVDEHSGPHVFVKGSHKINKLTSIRRLSDDEVSDSFGAENILRFTGPAGTAFLENTYGIHRGIPPSKTPRLLFQVLYSLAEYIGGPRRPVSRFVAEQDGILIDRYINRVYLS